MSIFVHLYKYKTSAVLMVPWMMQHYVSLFRFPQISHRLYSHLDSLSSDKNIGKTMTLYNLKSKLRKILLIQFFLDNPLVKFINHDRVVQWFFRESESGLRFSRHNSSTRVLNQTTRCHITQDNNLKYHLLRRVVALSYSDTDNLEPLRTVWRYQIASFLTQPRV
jgi:hypothetical protein